MFLLIVGVLVPVGMLGLGEFTGPRVHNINIYLLQHTVHIRVNKCSCFV